MGLALGGGRPKALGIVYASELIPFLILWFSRKIEFYQVVLLPTCLGLLFIVLGLCVCWVTVAIFTDYGKGTPAPWAPSKILIETLSLVFLKKSMFRYATNGFG